MMERKDLVRGVCMVLLLAACTPLQAKENGRPGGRSNGIGPRKFLLQLDANKNGRIDGPEVDKLRAAFNGPMQGDLARFDLDGDGRLDDGEVARIQLGTSPVNARRGDASGPGGAPVQ